MTRLFCNVCGAEVAANARSRHEGRVVLRRSLPEGGDATVSFRVRGEASGSDEGSICRYCLIDAVKASDDRGNS